MVKLYQRSFLEFVSHWFTWVVTISACTCASPLTRCAYSDLLLRTWVILCKWSYWQHVLHCGLTGLRERERERERLSRCEQWFYFNIMVLQEEHSINKELFHAYPSPWKQSEKRLWDHSREFGCALEEGTVKQREERGEIQSQMFYTCYCRNCFFCVMVTRTDFVMTWL